MALLLNVEMSIFIANLHVLVADRTITRRITTQNILETFLEIAYTAAFGQVSVR